MSATVDIIVPTYGQPEFTAKCFASIAQTAPPDSVRVVWVDNGTVRGPWTKDEDGNDVGSQMVWAEDHLTRAGVDVERVLLRENLGFIKATNVGMALSTAPYVMLLNNDAELPEGWLPRLLAPFSDAKVGIVGPRSSALTQWQSRVPLRAGWSVLADSRRQLSFFCCVIRRAVVEKIGYLSEEFGVGFADDDDYCVRARAAGFSLALTHDCIVLHHHRATFTAVYGDREWRRMLMQNAERFYKKHRTAPPAPVHPARSVEALPAPQQVGPVLLTPSQRREARRAALRRQRERSARDVQPSEDSGL